MKSDGRQFERCIYSGLATLLFLGTPSLALANAGLPMLAVVWPMSLYAIIPVIALESWLVARTLGIGWRSAATQMTKANIFSTLIGIPVAWLLTVALEFFAARLTVSSGWASSYPPHAVGQVGRVILSAPWLGPFRTGGNWIVPVATITLLVPFFFASFWSETWFVSRNWNQLARADIRRAIWSANGASYSMLLGACVVWLVIGLQHG